MAANSFVTEASPKPSRFFSFFNGLAASLSARVKISAGVFTARSASLKNSSTCFAPSPSISKAERETKCFSFSTACAGQISPPVQRRAESPGSRIAGLPQSGQVSGKA